MSAPSTPSARKNVLITGCSKGGMGYDMAKALALRPNYEVWATARSLEKMEGLPESVHLVVLDLMDQSSIERAASEVIKATNDKVDVLINNAAVQYVGPLIEMDMSLVRESFETNVLGPLAFTQLVAKGMMRRRTGRIVNVGSPSGWSVCPWQAPYGMSKAPTHVMADSLRQELRGFGIKVNVLIPGVVTTSITTKAIPSFQLKPDTFYESARESITQFVNNLLTPAGTSTEEFGRRFAGKLDRDRLGDYTLMGKQVNLLAFNYFMPRAFVDWVFGRVFGMDAVGQQERPKAA